jgi:hypothetical protein
MYDESFPADYRIPSASIARTTTVMRPQTKYHQKPDERVHDSLINYHIYAGNIKMKFGTRMGQQVNGEGLQ